MPAAASSPPARTTTSSPWPSTTMPTPSPSAPAATPSTTSATTTPSTSATATTPPPTPRPSTATIDGGENGETNGDTLILTTTGTDDARPEPHRHQQSGYRGRRRQPWRNFENLSAGGSTHALTVTADSPSARPSPPAAATTASPPGRIPFAADNIATNAGDDTVNITSTTYIGDTLDGGLNTGTRRHPRHHRR
jgi:hypothetical protein